MSDEKKKGEKPKGGGDTAKESGMESLKKNLDSFLQGDFVKDATRSGAQPTLRRKAEILAGYLKKFFPSDHLLRNDVSEAVIDFVGDRIRKLAKGNESWGGVAVIEIGEFIKMLGEEFCKENDDESGKTTKASAPTNSERAKTFDAGDAKLADADLDLILEAKSPEERPVVEEINTWRAAAWHAHKEAISHGPPKPEKPEEPGVPFSERVGTALKAVDRKLGEFNTAFAPKVEALKAKATEAHAKTAEVAEEAGWFTRMLDLPWKLVSKLWS